MILPDAQRMFMKDMPELIRNQLSASDVVTSFVVYPTKGTDPEALAADYGDAQLEALRLALGAVALAALLSLWFTRRLPTEALAA
jgi:hypothetical protein